MKYDFALMEFRPYPEHYEEVYGMFLKLVEEREYCFKARRMSHTGQLDPIFIGLEVRADAVDKLYSELEPKLEDKCRIIAGEEGLAETYYFVE